MYERNCPTLNTAVNKIKLQRDDLRAVLALLREKDELSSDKVIKAREIKSKLIDLQRGIREVVFSGLTAQYSVTVGGFYGYGDRMVRCHTVDDKVLSRQATGNKYVWVQFKDEPAAGDNSDDTKAAGEMELVQVYQLFPVARARMMRRFRDARID